MPAAKPRILVVTPEITYLPEGMGNMAQRMSAKAGGLADVSASLVAALFDLGADVHVALPNYRQMFHTDVYEIFSRELQTMRQKLPDERIHLAEDRIFYYRDSVYSSYGGENPRIALAFQREVLNHILPRVQPDLIHCNDWMTGLIPAAARQLRIPTLFTVHNIHTEKLTLARIEETGIDAARFWQHLYYSMPPGNYEQARNHAPVDQLASGIFAAHYINTVSPSFLDEVADGRHSFVPPPVQQEIRNKRDAGCAIGILNAPDASYNPATDVSLPVSYDAINFPDGKRAAKAVFQERAGLIVNPDAPLFFWPSRLDPVQKGPQLLTSILYRIVSENWHSQLQVAVVANGEYQRIFRDIVRQHNFHDRVAVFDFNEGYSRLGYAAADFCFMPSSFEPCGLPQMVAPIYGTLTIAHNTGGLKDTVSHLSGDGSTGNGFVFEHFNPDALHWAVNQAMAFHRRPQEQKETIVRRIMRESVERFNHAACARAYFNIYETMLKRPLILPDDPPAKASPRPPREPNAGPAKEPVPFDRGEVLEAAPVS
ncbi:MAG TPA: glycogen/starch synthase [Verrucomicrobiales bacterium]|jgi:ADP-glucose type glycogen/starch synthase|nr:glycogen/starch synthase [Verrucomicrobiales bacterium]